MCENIFNLVKVYTCCCKIFKGLTFFWTQCITQILSGNQTREQKVFNGVHAIQTRVSPKLLEIPKYAHAVWPRVTKFGNTTKGKTVLELLSRYRGKLCSTSALLIIIIITNSHRSKTLLQVRRHKLSSSPILCEVLTQT